MADKTRFTINIKGLDNYAFKTIDEIYLFELLIYREIYLSDLLPFWMRHEDIVDKLKVNAKRADTILKEFEEIGFLTIEHKRGKRTVYDVDFLDLSDREKLKRVIKEKTDEFKRRMDNYSTLANQQKKRRAGNKSRFNDSSIRTYTYNDALGVIRTLNQTAKERFDKFRNENPRKRASICIEFPETKENQKAVCEALNSGLSRSIINQAFLSYADDHMKRKLEPITDLFKYFFTKKEGKFPVIESYYNHALPHYVFNSDNNDEE